MADNLSALIVLRGEVLISSLNCVQQVNTGYVSRSSDQGHIYAWLVISRFSTKV